MRYKIAVMSLKFSPGLFKEVNEICHGYYTNGYKVKAILANSYSSMADERLTANSNVFFVKTVQRNSLMIFGLFKSFFKIIKQLTGDLDIFFYNQHPLNIFVLGFHKMTKKNGKRIIFLHEPYKDEKFISYGFSTGLRFVFVDLIQKLSLYFCTDAVLPSDLAITQFKKAYPNSCAAIHYCPLMLRNNPGKKSMKRKYVTVFGRFDATKTLDDFIKTLEKSTQEGLDYDFQIVTSSNIDNQINKISSLSRSKLKIINPNFLDDQTINDALMESFCVMLLYKNVTQSGAMVVSFMNGLPVVCSSEKGLSQFVDNNGVVLSDSYDIDEILKSIALIHNNFNEYSDSALKTFNSLHDSNNFSYYYKYLL